MGIEKRKEENEEEETKYISVNVKMILNVVIKGPVVVDVKLFILFVYVCKKVDVK